MNLNSLSRVAIAVGAACLLTLGTMATAAPASAATKYSNCSQLNRSFSHGVGLPGARDKVSGNKRAVTNYRADAATYKQNKGLDRDRDGIACEKK